jgi:hypothetical protein
VKRPDFMLPGVAALTGDDAIVMRQIMTALVAELRDIRVQLDGLQRKTDQLESAPKMGPWR